MLFNSFHYVFFLIGVLLAIDMLRKQKLQYTFLLLASYYFYWVFSSFYVILLVISTLVDFFCGLAISRATDPQERKFFLILSLAGQLGLLGYFKYRNFGISLLNSSLAMTGIHESLRYADIVLPVGISFYTFMSLSYTMDIYFERFQPIYSLKTFALFLTFFPHLVAGPILRAAAFLPQLEKRLVLSSENLRMGLSLILYGLIKKVVFADNLSPFVRRTFAGEPTHDSLVVFLAIIAFAVQIYCDFSGYTDIAIGSARLLGLTFPGNFKHPYFSRNITEFWQRWHISLSTWLRDYLYIPLGGNRKGKGRQYINLMVTMLLGGLWHGAAWNFVLWGLYHGLFLAGHRLLGGDRRFMGSRLWDLPKIAVTFWLTCIGWLIFIVPDVHKLSFYVRKLMFVEFSPSSFRSFVNAEPFVVFLIAAFFVIHAVSYWMGDLVNAFAGLRRIAWCAYVAAGLLVLYFGASSQQQSFIYFRF